MMKKPTYEELEQKVKRLEADSVRQSQTEKLLQSRLRLVEYSLTHSMHDLLQTALDEVCGWTRSAHAW